MNKPVKNRRRESLHSKRQARGMIRSSKFWVRSFENLELWTSNRRPSRQSCFSETSVVAAVAHASNAPSGCADDKPYGTVMSPILTLDAVRGRSVSPHMSVGSYGFFLCQTVTVDQTGLSYLSAGNAEWIAAPSRSAG